MVDRIVTFMGASFAFFSAIVFNQQNQRIAVGVMSCVSALLLFILILSD